MPRVKSDDTLDKRPIPQLRRSTTDMEAAADWSLPPLQSATLSANLVFESELPPEKRLNREHKQNNDNIPQSAEKVPESKSSQDPSDLKHQSESRLVKLEHETDKKIQSVPELAQEEEEEEVDDDDDADNVEALAQDDGRRDTRKVLKRTVSGMEVEAPPEGF